MPSLHTRAFGGAPYWSHTEIEDFLHWTERKQRDGTSGYKNRFGEDWGGTKICRTKQVEILEQGTKRTDLSLDLRHTHQKWPATTVPEECKYELLLTSYLNWIWCSTAQLLPSCLDYLEQTS